jgi:hypothetical protein
VMRWHFIVCVDFVRYRCRLHCLVFIGPADDHLGLARTLVVLFQALLRLHLCILAILSTLQYLLAHALVGEVLPVLAMGISYGM